ncbi:MAG TPA: hypothetical protein P5079_06845 [Elusimicrobiota bacterium]|nr:hypothetical protein [Elusimicrobiota bacterium]
MKMVRPLLRRHIVSLALRSSVFRSLFASFYAFLLLLLKRRAAAGALKTLYLRQGLLEPEWIPGASDIDTLWVCPKPDISGTHTGRLLRRLAQLKKLFPFLGESQVVDEAELSAYLRHGDAKRRTAVQWKPLHGQPLPPGPPTDPAGWEWPWDCWAQAFDAHELLLQCYFSEEDGAATRRLNARKHLLDVHRWFFAMDSGAPPPTREETAHKISARSAAEADPEKSWALPLLQSADLPLGKFPQVLARTMTCLRRRGDNIVSRFPSGKNAPPPPAGRPHDDAWERQAWEKRFRALRERDGEGISGLAWDTVRRATILLRDDLPEDAAAELLKTLRHFKKGDRGLRGPLTVVPEQLFRLRQWSIAEGTPFGPYGLRTDIPAGTSAAWRPSTRPLLRNHFCGQIGLPKISPPPAPVLDRLARQTAADWLLNRRTYPLAALSSPPLYVWQSLLMPALSARLYLFAGIASDPHDLEGALLLCRETFPEDKPWWDALLRTLEVEEPAWDGRAVLETMEREAAGFEKTAGALLEGLGG